MEHRAPIKQRVISRGDLGLKQSVYRALLMLRCPNRYRTAHSSPETHSIMVRLNNNFTWVKHLIPLEGEYNQVCSSDNSAQLL